MIFTFENEVIEWRGPAPFLFIPVPHELSAEIKAFSSLVTYGWGVIPVRATIGKTEYTTSLFPKDGVYLVPVKVAVQRAESLKLGDQISMTLELVLKR